MKRKFQVGDKVRALDSSGWGFKAGNIYTISQVNESTSYRSGIMIYTDKDERGEYNGWCASKFELVEESAKKILTLPTDSEARKDVPVFSGCVKYFPAALAGVSKISKAGNDKHNPGQELHHDRSKSLDHADCLGRHLIDLADLIAALERGESITTEQILTEASSVAWRALAYSQSLHEKYAGAPLAPGAKLKKGNENE